MTQYRISYEPEFGSTMIYCVEKKKLFFWHYVSNSWFKTEQEARDFIQAHKQAAELKLKKIYV